MTKLFKPRFLALFAAPNAAFVLLSLFVSAETLINGFNAALMALSVGVVVAYHKPVGEILFGNDEMDRADWLALGIFLSWSGRIVLGIHTRSSGAPSAGPTDSRTRSMSPTVCS